MTTKQLIEKAIEGGWNCGWQLRPDTELRVDSDGMVQSKTADYESPWQDLFHVSQIFLDPLAWQAVGRCEGWNEYTDYGIETLSTQQEEIAQMRTWKYYMHRMIDALAEGKTIEEFLSTL